MARKVKKRRLEEITSNSENEYQQNLNKVNQAGYESDSDSDSLFVNDIPKLEKVKGKEKFKDKKINQKCLEKNDIDNDENHTESQYE